MRTHPSVLQFKYLPSADAHQFLLALPPLNSQDIGIPLITSTTPLSIQIPPLIHVDFKHSITYTYNTEQQQQQQKLELSMTLHSPFSVTCTSTGKYHLPAISWIEISLPITHPIIHTALTALTPKGKSLYTHKCTTGKVTYDAATQLLLWRLNRGWSYQPSSSLTMCQITIPIPISSPITDPIFNHMRSSCITYMCTI